MAYYDPNQAWADPYGYGYDGYGYGGEEPQEDTESQKERKQQELIEALESNRLYLKKVRRKCVQEDFADLEQTQMFLFEFLIESLEVNAKSELGLVPEEIPEDRPMEIVARVQFLDNPYIEIKEKGEKMETSDSVMGENEYFEVVGNAGLKEAVESKKAAKEAPEEARTPTTALSAGSGSPGGSLKEGDAASVEPSAVVVYDTKWENASGKSLLFSKAALDTIQGIDDMPVKVQVCISVEPLIEEVEENESVSEASQKWSQTSKQPSQGTQGSKGSQGTQPSQPVPSQTSQPVSKASAPPEPKPDCEPLGYALIRLPDHFSLSVLQSCKPGVILPVSCVHRETCELRNVFGAKKGEMQVFVRLSCFGSVITTSFQSVGPERRYVFKPSPMPDESRKDPMEFARDTVLKPIITEEEEARGLTVIAGEDDVFAKSVLWKDNTKNCGCMDLPSDLSRYDGSSTILRMPRASDISLCRNAVPGQPGRNMCDWHHLVSKGIQNNPGGNCGCLDEPNVIKRPTASLEIKSSDPKSDHDGSQGERVEKKPSRMEKLRLKWKRESKSQTLPKVPEKEVKPVEGPGIPPCARDCQCNCIPIKEALNEGGIGKIVRDNMQGNPRKVTPALDCLFKC